MAVMPRCKPESTILRILIMLAGFVPVLVFAELTNLPELARSAVSPPSITAKSWLLMDYNSGWILIEERADERIEPASLSKLMTAYVVFNELEQQRLSLETKVHVSKRAWKTPGSRMFIKVDTEVSVDDLLKGLIVQSGNDAAVALAEHIAGSEEGFAEVMNKTAAEIGLNNTRYQNSTGLPHPEHYSTARDISLLASRLIQDFPQYYQIYSIKEFTYNKIKQGNRNALLWRDNTVDGVKTGHTNSAGYCLVGSANRDGRRLIATVVGADNKQYRADAVHSLLKYGFAAYETRRLYERGKPATAIDVFMGDSDKVNVGVVEDLFVTLPRGKFADITASIKNVRSQSAPISVGRELGELNIILDGEPLYQYPLVALEDVAAGSWLKQAMDTVRLWFR